MKKMNNKAVSFGTTKSSFYYWFWVILSVIVSLLTSASIADAPGKAIVGSTFLMVGYLIYPTMEKYYGGLDFGVIHVIAVMVKFFDAVLGVSLFFSAALKIILF